jgi:hypothetical protein
MARLSSAAEARAAARTTRRRVIAIASVAAVLVVGVIVLATTRAPAARPTAGAAGHAGATAMPSPGSSSYVPPARWVTLPPATGEDQQMPVGYPHSPLGAAAMAASTVSYAWCALPQQAAAAASVYADPDQQQQAVTAATGLVGELRQKTGLPATGPLPAGANIQAIPYAVKYTAQDQNTVVVDVAFNLQWTTGTGQATTTQPMVVAGTMVWVNQTSSGQDWHYTLTPTSGTPDYPTPAEVGTPAFNQAGWQAIQSGAGR